MSKINNKSVKELRRTRAEEWHAKYNALDDRAKLDLVAKRPGESKRETARILARLEGA